jgi:hypothetical protein
MMPVRVTVAQWFKAWTVLALLDAGIVGSNPTEALMFMCMCTFILCLCCFVWVEILRWADHSSKEVYWLS